MKKCQFLPLCTAREHIAWWNIYYIYIWCTHIEYKSRIFHPRARWLRLVFLRLTDRYARADVTRFGKWFIHTTQHTYAQSRDPQSNINRARAGDKGVVSSRCRRRRRRLLLRCRFDVIWCAWADTRLSTRGSGFTRAASAYGIGLPIGPKPIYNICGLIWYTAGPLGSKVFGGISVFHQWHKVFGLYMRYIRKSDTFKWISFVALTCYNLCQLCIRMSLCDLYLYSIRLNYVFRFS